METIKNESVENLEESEFSNIKEQEIIDVNVSNDFLNLIYGKDEENFKNNISDIKNNYEIIFNKCKKILEEQDEIKEISKELKIEHYKFITGNKINLEKLKEYYKNLDMCLKDKKEEYVAVSEFDKKITNILPENAINNLLLNQKIKKIIYKIEEINNDNEINKILKKERMQLNVLEQLINNKFEILKAKIHLIKLQEQLSDIDKKNIVEKVVDKISGRYKIDIEKKKKISEIIENVNNKIKFLEKNDDLDFDKRINFENLIAKMEIFIEDEVDNTEFNSSEGEEIRHFYKEVIYCCNFDEEKVKEEKEELKKTRLPVLVEKEKLNIFKFKNKKREEAISEFNNEIGEFASKNGYYFDASQNEFNYEKNYRIKSKLNKVFEVLQEIDEYITSD